MYTVHVHVALTFPGLSSGEDSESEEDEPPEGFTAAVFEDRAGWAELAHSSSVPPVTIREIHCDFVKRRLKKEHVTATKPFEKGYKIYTAGKVQSITTKCTSSYSIIRAECYHYRNRQDFTKYP